MVLDNLLLVSQMKHKVIIITLLLILSTLTTGLFYPCEADRCVKELSEVTSIHQGDLIISGYTNYTIIDERFDINGSIIVQDNAILYLKNATINIIQTIEHRHNMTFGKIMIGGAPKLQAINSTITSDDELWINFLGSSSLIVSNLNISNGFLDLSESSTGTLSNCAIEHMCTSSGRNVTILNSKIELMQACCGSKASFTNSTVGDLTIDVCSDFSLLGLMPGNFDFWNFRQVSLIKTRIESFGFFVYSCKATIINSTIGFLSVSEPARWVHSVVNISNCIISRLMASDSSEILVSNSTISTLDAHLFSTNCTIAGLTPGFIDSWNLPLDCSVVLVGTANYAPNVTLKDVQIGNWSFWLSSSNVKIFKSSFSQLSLSECLNVTVWDSTIETLFPFDHTYVWLINTTYHEFQIYSISEFMVYVCWYLAVHVTDEIDQDVYFANVTVTYSNSTVASNKTTNAKGWANFTLIEKKINATGSFPVGNYTVTVTYETYSGEQTVNMTGNKEININLSFIIPEFPLALILPLLVILSLVAVVLRKRIDLL